jgi:hypothetical protein
LIFKNLILPKENELLDLKTHFDIRRNMNIDVLDEFTPIQDIRRSVLRWFCLREFTPISGHNFLVTIIKLFNLFVELQEDYQKNEPSVR